jgi:hypothetical protein
MVNWRFGICRCMSCSIVIIINTRPYELIVPWKGEFRFLSCRYFFST